MGIWGWGMGDGLDNLGILTYGDLCIDGLK